MSPATEIRLSEDNELLVRSPCLFSGYFNDPATTAEVLRDGWCYTGDLARVDARGFYTIVDRRKEMIISGGYNVYPREVEDVLYRHPAVLAAAVVAQPDPKWGETPCAFVEVNRT